MDFLMLSSFSKKITLFLLEISLTLILVKFLIKLLSQKNYKSLDDVKIFNSLEDFLKFCENLRKEVFVIGGSEIYNALEPYCTKLVITHIQEKFDGDAFFTIDLSKWNEISSEEFFDKSSKLNCEIKTYIRN